MESRSETLRATDVVNKRQGDGFSVRADNLQIRPCDRILRLDTLGACLKPGRLIELKEVHVTREA